jgi:predicted amidohydrolase
VIFGQDNKAEDICVRSSRFRTQHGVHPGMRIGEYRKVYPTAREIYYHEGDDKYGDYQFFIPFDMNTH